MSYNEYMIISMINLFGDYLLSFIRDLMDGQMRRTLMN